jgi:hypothetical protein
MSEFRHEIDYVTEKSRDIMNEEFGNMWKEAASVLFF